MGKKATSVYLQIAVDMAGKIVRQEYKIGEKLSGRTTLASQYNVSPETIRKAMRLLADVHIVKIIHGNGIHVSSAEHAEAFIDRFKIKTTVNELKEELISLMKQRDEIELKMNESMNSIIDYTSRFKNSDHISVNEYYMNYDVLPFEKTLEELAFKKNTGITLVAIKRNNHMMISPDEDEIVMAQDHLYYVGVPSSSVRLGEYLRATYNIK